MSDVVHLRVMCTTDLHMELLPYDYFSDQPSKRGGLARAADFIDDLRKQASNTLLFDNGDVLQGTPMADLLASEFEAGKRQPHPMISALNIVGVDAATLGNHEFNFGIDFLTDAISTANFPIVCANATNVSGETLFPPYVLLERELCDELGNSHALRIGVIGLLPPQILEWDFKHLSGQLTTAGIFETAQKCVPQLKHEGADLVVVLSHSGVGDGDISPDAENASLALSKLHDVDIVFAGHSHLVFPSERFAKLPSVDLVTGQMNGTPTAMAGFGGSHLAVADLVLTRRAEKWSVVKSVADAKPIPAKYDASGQSATKIRDSVADVHARTLEFTRQPIGATQIDLHTYFAMLEPAPPVRLVAEAQARSAQELLKKTKYSQWPLLSAAAPFKMGGRGGPTHFTYVESGPVLMRNIADIYGYPNTLSILAISGSNLRDWLEYTASFFRQIKPNALQQDLVDPEFPSFNFDTFTGIDYDFDLTVPGKYAPDGALLHPNTSRVRNLRYKGQTIQDDDTFMVATNDYRSNSSNIPGANASHAAIRSTQAHRDILVSHFRRPLGENCYSDGGWTLRPIKGASVVVLTSPKALKLTNDLLKFGVKNIGQDKNGFQLFEKAL